ncbi:SAR2788 family putative toxin [Bacillus haynesii]|uniref:SAR2788 family putative toxin n=1 Tax=Bacillus haynesii TaxID=1925021 RepID=UPI002281BB00|nr:SAR2788 family putative toxin [Bacillus haynesii]MCY7772165.1 SAR2788 family putative toxin [Bacillus haynesii]MCY8011231.1 SAR2788 family putative toxin [Bacillus haynesii]MEC0763959.1 SAR2788 family putative toxin [Bacillus haynesii]MEC0784853.1 SAR2788 family putative toxin [Bacillus haynesii]
MKKYFISLIVLALFTAYIPTGFVLARELKERSDDPIYITSIESGENIETTEIDLEEELNVSEDDKVTTKQFTEDNIDTYESTLDTEEVYLKSVLDYNSETGEITANALLKDSYGNDVEKNFSIIVLNSDGTDLKAIFVDQDTGEQYTVNTDQVTASVWPVVGALIGFIAKQGLKQAIKKWGPSVIRGMIASSETVAKAVAKELGYSATKYVSHGAKVYKRVKGKGPKYITRDKDGHNGGVWKGASSVKNLGSKKTRSGTYDAELRRIGD